MFLSDWNLLDSFDGFWSLTPPLKIPGYAAGNAVRSWAFETT